MMDDELEQESYHLYNEWADEGLVWGRGMFNWCRDWTQTPASILPDIDDTIEIPF